MNNNPMIARLKDIAIGTMGNSATYAGVAWKSMLLVAIVAVSACLTWAGGYATSVTTMVTAVLALLLLIVVSVQPSLAANLSPLYAILKGMCLAGISVSLDLRYPGIVMNAVLLTLAIAMGAGFAFRMGWVRVTERFRFMTSVAILGVLLVYLLDLILYFFGMHVPMLHETGPLGIGVSLLIIGVATMCLFTDYDFIQRSVERGMAKDYEWYCAFSLLVTLVWLYIQVLDLLRKIASSR